MGSLRHPGLLGQSSWDSERLKADDMPLSLRQCSELSNMTGWLLSVGETFDAVSTFLGSGALSGARKVLAWTPQNHGPASLLGTSR